ncbi:BREX-1 system adenine-specific DNA-methyltransferase PglX [Clostridium algidicarnis]|uniref:BREX-1 system adenine-specific DNA-methyltransferase PglX n=1 Tax=Clostridium algidicarnis TaxID=37659 RepID=UPI001C0B11C9|nr:BREX-1 system adenine-specific DNA-methyltransferase PglX [Clostridium algidicarnis]MBU3210062.1 BREX-1 system adenine-specific DNA-methyltransferase PglX [Clostridium algidicarnis]
MDKNKIKSFAIWARRNLIGAVSERANRIGVTENKILDAVAVQGGFKLEGNDEIFKLSKEHREKLVKEVNEKGFEQVMEEVAYTWFNRFMGLRYMEVNEYLPTGVRVLSSEVQGKTEPDVLTRVSEVIDELKLNSEYIYELLDSGKTEDREEAYKHILVRQCNELGKIIPQMFEKISDYTELLLPDNLLEEGSVIRRMVEDIEEADFKEEKSLVEDDNIENKKTGGVEIIGWMYQYYISEKKDEVFAALKKNVKITKENIPAATQLFTPKWIVKYMVENSLGRLWLEKLEGDSEQAGVGSGQWAVISDELKSKWKYYLEEAEQEPEVEEELKKIREEHSKLKPQDIKVLDPCMGSGHILVYAFDVLYEIYKTAGYSEREIPRMILKNNLYGLDIDDRAAQLSSFALIMKARHYNRRLFREIEREGLDLNLCSIQESNEISKETIDYFVGENQGLRKDVEYLVDVFTDAKEYGSILEVEKVNFETLKQRLKEIEEEQNFTFGDYRKMLLDKLPIIIKQAETMSREYEVCVTNPPYMGRKGMEEKLKKYVEKVYSDSKSDLFSVFIDKYTKNNIKFYTALITMQSWMFLSSYKTLRNKLLTNNSFSSLLQIGYNSFPGMNSQIAHATTFIIYNKHTNEFKGTYCNLNNESITADKEKVFLKRIDDKDFYIRKQKDYLNIPGENIAYWISDNMKNVFSVATPLGNIAEPKQGMATADNSRFTRMWFEVDREFIGLKYENAITAKESNKKWFPYNKGGDFRKWYGNNEFVVNWENDGYEIKNFNASVIRNEGFYFKRGITWSLISTSNFAARLSEGGFLFDVGGSTVFPEKDILEYILALMNSKVAYEILKMIAPTINFQVGDIKEIPIIFSNDDSITSSVINLSRENIKISKFEWDSFENSWDFKCNPLVKNKENRLEDAFQYWENNQCLSFENMKRNEEEINKKLISIYELSKELTSDIEDKYITIRKADRERDIKSFISYAVGCMFGRYSIDAEGLIYAGGDFGDKWVVGSEQCKVRKIEKDEDGNVISDSWVDATFVPDGDNVIPITEDEYFEDDIVSRFIEFVRTVYGEETLEENLDFIADSIDRKPSETARQAIRRYFIKDFYKDHLKVYKKRPIYWMLDSGKNDGFKALVYMHRYNAQTVARVRTDYLHTLQRKYEAEMQRQQLVVDSEEYTAKDRTAAKKKIGRIAKQIEECREYDQVVAHLANEKISIDLDDGVKVNYERFQGVKVINSKDKEVKMDLLAKI